MSGDSAPASRDVSPTPVLSRTSWIGLSCLGALLVLLAWAWILNLPLTGADVWPILAQAGRVAEHPVSLLTERYLEGLWDGATFWRPALVAFAAIERAVFGESAMPYHLLRLVLLLATALVLARSAAGLSAAPGSAALVALALYLLHPIQVESVPVVARDGDALSALFMSAALLLLAEGRRARAPRWRLVLGVVLALVAPGFKEPALLVLPLGVFVLAPWARREPRHRAALIASAALAAGLLAHVGARFALLGTLGRYNSPEAETGLVDGLRGLVGALVDHPGMGWPAGVALLLAGAALAAQALAATARRNDTGRAFARRLVLAHAGWLAVMSATFVLSLRFRTRYAEAVLAPLVLLAACWVGSLVAKAREGRGFAAWAAPALAAAALAFAFLPGSTILWSYPQWQTAGRTQQLVMQAVGETIEETRLAEAPASRQVGAFRVSAEAIPGRGTPVNVSVSPFPFKTARPEGRLQGGLSTAVIIGSHSIEGFVAASGLGPLGSVTQGPAAVGVLPRDLPQGLNGAR